VLAEYVLDGMSADARRLRACLKSHLHGFKHVPVLPMIDASVWRRRALRLQRAARTRGRPVLVDRHPVFDRGEPMDRGLACRTDIFVMLGIVGKVALVESAIGLAVRRKRLWNKWNDPDLLACQDLFTLEITPVRQRRELRGSERITRVLGHRGQMRAVVADVADLVRHDQMMLGVHCRLEVVANHAGAAAT